MQKADHAGQAFARMLIDQGQALCARTLQFPRDIIGFETQMMETAAAPGQELADRVVRTERLQQFYFAAADLQQCGFDALLLNDRAFGELKPQGVAPEAVSLLKPGNHDSDVMDPLQHSFATAINLT